MCTAIYITAKYCDKTCHLSQWCTVRWLLYATNLYSFRTRMTKRLADTILDPVWNETKTELNCWRQSAQSWNMILRRPRMFRWHSCNYIWYVKKLSLRARCHVCCMNVALNTIGWPHKNTSLIFNNLKNITWQTIPATADAQLPTVVTRGEG
jgi:hypothetical protein